EISPIGSEFSPRFELSFLGQDGKPKWKFEDYAADSGYPTTAEQARKTNMTHAKRMIMEVWLRDTQTGELRKSNAYMADVPVITDRGTFVINGTERVVLGQLVRAPGIYYSSPTAILYKALLLAEQGAPVTFELELDPTISNRASKAKCRMKLPKRSWVNCTTVLTALGVDQQIIQKRLVGLLERNRIEYKPITVNEALAAVGRAWKPDGGGGANGGLTALKELTDKRRYSLGKLGRRRLNKKLGLDEESLQLTANDILNAVEYLLSLPLGVGTLDNVDSLENRHLRGVGETLTRAIRPALAQMVRSIRTRLELNEDEEIGSPNDLLDTRPFANAITKFFAGNPLVQYLDQQNPLSELSHRRRITSFGPGGIDPNAAPVEMRDVHPSQIGRVCLVESPEGKNCGMVSYMATYCRIDDDGFMTVPYRKVVNGYLTDEVQYLAPGDDKKYTLAPPDTRVEGNRIAGPLVSARRGENFFQVTPEEVDMIGITPQGFISVGSALIPFLEHDDANRALMGGGMMRQTLPLVRPERPRVGTGMEKIVARSSGHSIAARRAGTVSVVTANEIVITQASGERRYYPLIRFDRTNQNTILDQRPGVKVGQKVEAGQIIADGPGIDKGELALGRNLLIAFLPWRGYNFEDAIVVREGLVKDHKLTHIEIEKHSTAVYQTLRGPEILTPELPNVAGKDLEHLDERGIAKIGSYVNPGDVLVSKLSPKEARALSAEEELLQAIFGKVAEEMADTSLRVPHGSGGRVIDVRIFTPETTPELKAGVICEIEVLIARLCPVEVGDKLAGRHGNKGIVSIIVPDEDMPFLPDGTPVDLCLNPLGVPSRMNVGQVFDTQLGLYASILNRYYRIHQFDESLTPDASFKLVNEALKEVKRLPGYEWLGEDGKVQLFDGKTGEPFDRPVLVGRQYMLKLNQLVLHKINARSGLGGPYAAVTQQPVGGKANHGGQRMGEMEVWAIQAYGAANILNEMMTIKADDIQGRHEAYADMVQGKNVPAGGRTAAFDGLCCELRGLGLEVTLGKIVDSFEPVHDKYCSQENTPPRTLEEEYQVSSVDKLESDGVKMLEIPAGDYVPIVKPPMAPIITSITNGRHGAKPRIEMSDEPLIDDIEEPKDSEAEAKEKSLLDAFIDEQTKDILSLESLGDIDLLESLEEQMSMFEEETSAQEATAAPSAQGAAAPSAAPPSAPPIPSALAAPGGSAPTLPPRSEGPKLYNQISQLYQVDTAQDAQASDGGWQTNFAPPAKPSLSDMLFEASETVVPRPTAAQRTDAADRDVSAVHAQPDDAAIADQSAVSAALDILDELAGDAAPIDLSACEQQAFDASAGGGAFDASAGGGAFDASAGSGAFDAPGGTFDASSNGQVAPSASNGREIEFTVTAGENPDNDDEPDFDTIFSETITGLHAATAIEPASGGASPDTNAVKPGLSQLSNELAGGSSDPLLDFPSLNELQTLASELLTLGSLQNTVVVGSRGTVQGDSDETALPNHDESTKARD
ncbi:MAG TPA: DNA-directed RNA polymerase subunit beta, partial [Candidatus Obscuribacterales bacterium]